MKLSEQREQLIGMLLAERGEVANVPVGEQEQRSLLRALVNTRQPNPASEEMLALEDAYLQGELTAKNVVDAATLPELEPGISLWQGDITLLAADAIVNAANSQMLGCFVPGHSCIDNAIHTFAGMRLRLACAELMAKQGTPEPTGSAKVTSAFNLPSRYVVHTVGPIVGGMLEEEHCEQLAACYTSCLNAAHAAEAKSIAFCCISTGVFGFPNKEAAHIAVETVRTWREKNNSNMKVVFNVFKQLDFELYTELLGSAR